MPLPNLTLEQTLSSIESQLAVMTGELISLNTVIRSLRKSDAAVARLDAFRAKLAVASTATTLIRAQLMTALSTTPVPTPTPIPTPIPIPNASTVIRVHAGDDVQAALDQAALDLRNGSVTMRFDPGVDYPGNFLIRARADHKAGATLMLRTDAAESNFTSPKPWVEPLAAQAMVGFSSRNSDPTFTCEDGAHDFSFYGIAALPNLAFPDTDLFRFGRDDMTALSQVPSRIGFDACYFSGGATTGQLRGLAIHGAGVSIARSYFERFMIEWRDSQAIYAAHGPGPYLIRGCFIEGGAENLMVGGADPTIVGLVPSDITIHGCHFFKPPSWKDQLWQVKNLFELKNARRVLVEDSLFENCWPAAQNGHGLVLTTRNQDGRAPWSTVADVTIRYCVVKNVDGSTFNMLGLDDQEGVTSVQGVNILIEHVLTVGCRNGALINNGFHNTKFRHNTFADIAEQFLYFTGSPLPPGSFEFTSNVTRQGLYGIMGDGYGAGIGALNHYAPAATFTHNVIERGPDWVGYPSGNYLLAPGGLTLDARKRYNTILVGPDGKKIGADVDGLIARMPWASW